MVIIRYVQIGPPNQHWLNYFIFANPLFLSRRIQYRRPQLKALTLLWGSRTPPQGCFPTHLYLLYLPALFSPSLRHTAVCNIDGPRLCLSHSSRTRLCNRNDPSFDRRPYNIPDISAVVDRWAFFYSCERQNMLDRKTAMTIRTNHSRDGPRGKIAAFFLGSFTGGTVLSFTIVFGSCFFTVGSFAMTAKVITI